MIAHRIKWESITSYWYERVNRRKSEARLHKKMWTNKYKRNDGVRKSPLQETTRQESPPEKRGFWEDGRVGSTKNLAPHLEIITLAESVWCNYFGTLEFPYIEGLHLPGKSLCNKLWLISVHFSS